MPKFVSSFMSLDIIFITFVKLTDALGLRLKVVVAPYLDDPTLVDKVLFVGVVPPFNNVLLFAVNGLC